MTRTIPTAPRRRVLLLAALLLPLLAAPAAAQTGGQTGGQTGAQTGAQTGGMVTLPSSHSAAETTKRLHAAITAVGWLVFGDIDHAAAARAAGLELRTRTVVLFGNPTAGTPPMRAKPTLALDLPMRMLVWEDDQGRVMLTRSTGDDVAERIFARHGIAIDAQARAGTEKLLDGLARKATE